MAKEAKQFLLTKCASFTRGPAGRRYVNDGKPIAPADDKEAAYLEKNRHFEVYVAPNAEAAT